MLKHVLVIPDGNRRYAKEHNRSFQAVYDYAILDITTRLIKFFLIENDVQIVTIYGLSLNNVQKRQLEELEPIFESQIKAYRKWQSDSDFKKAKVAFHFIGELKKLPKNYQEAIKKLEKATTIASKKTCNILVAYDAESEILDVFKSIQKDKCTIEPDSALLNFLQLKIPIDLVFRSGYEKRLSGAPLLQVSQAELIFTDYYYPELNKKKMEEIMSEYNKRKRRHGI